MRFLPKNITPDEDLLIKLSGKSIKSTQSMKFLGVSLDLKLT